MPKARKELSLGQITDRISRAVFQALNKGRATRSPEIPLSDDWWIQEIFPAYVIARKGDKNYRILYSFTDVNDPASFKLGDPEEVEMLWIPKTVTSALDAVVKTVAGKEVITKSEEDGDHTADHYLVVEDKEKPTTWHLRVRDASGKIDHRLMGAAYAALTVGYRGNKYQGPQAAEAMKKLRALYRSEKMPLPRNETGKETSSIIVTKGKDGKMRWITMSSNAFRDRDNEIVSLKSLIADVENSDATGDYGVLRWWHVSDPVPLDLGKCDFRMVLNRTLIESGTFFDEQIGAKVKEHAPHLQVSLGFRHPLNEPDADGVYHNIRTFERSLLPVGRAANALTRFLVDEKRS